jgi:hemoglobin
MAITLPVDPDLTGPSPRQRLAPGYAVGVTEDMIRDVVDGFYDKVRADPTLGPIFDGHIGDKWHVHLPKMYDFWSSVLLMTGRFKGAPMRVHGAMAHEVGDSHFDRWLELFGQTVDEVCPPPAAALFLEKARMIASSLSTGMAFVRGDDLTAR